MDLGPIPKSQEPARRLDLDKSERPIRISVENLLECGRLGDVDVSSRHLIVEIRYELRPRAVVGV